MNKPFTYGFFLKIILISGLLVGMATGLHAQWEAVYFNNANFPDLQTVAFTTRDNGLAAGNDGLIIRTDNSGLNWETVFTEPNELDLVDIQFTAPTTAYVLGRNLGGGCASGDKGLIAKTNNYGATWQLTYTDTSLYASHFPTPNIGYAVGDCGAVYKTSDGGNTWQWMDSGFGEVLSTVFFIDELNGFAAGPGENFIKTIDGGNSWIDEDLTDATDYTDVTFPTADVGYLLTNLKLHKTENAGNDWTEISIPFSNGDSYTVMYFVDENTGWIATNNKLYKTTNGGVNWNEETANTNSTAFTSILFDLYFLDANYGFVVGSQGYFKTTTGGTSLPEIQYLSGNVFNDTDPTCVLESSESGLENWIIRINGNGLTTYTTTDANGDYFVALETGDYDISLVLPNANWIDGCQAIYNETLSNPFDTLILNIPAREAVFCPVLEVDVSTNALNHCFNNTYTVRYVNTGTATALSPYVEITLDKDLTMVSNFWTNVSGNSYTLDLPAIEVGETGSFSFVAFLECNPIVGQTHSVTANIYPNDFCLPPSPSWNGASLKVDALCEGDSVSFTISNTGLGDTDGPQGFVIIEDHIIFFDGDVDIDSGVDTTIVVYPQGTTLRMEVEQVAEHPGRSSPSVTYEACAADMDGNISTGFYTQYPEDDAAVFVSMDCQESTASAVTTIKRAYPKGYGDEHFIEANVDLDYHILFQNTNTDTVYTVIVQDTLSQWLDASSIRQGTSSHPYTFSLSGNGVARFVFSDIQLSPGETGFAKFRVRQLADNPDGTLIQNEACFSYDYGAFNKTNTTTHLVDANFVEIADTALLSGFIQNENDENVALVDVINNWQNLVQTDNNGYYHLDNVELMYAYLLAPQKDTNLLNGVDAYDLYFMQQYIIGNELLESPYAKIAADVDRSGSITTLDVLNVQRAILLLADTFPNNHSWRFISEPYDFPDPENPFANVFPEAFKLNTPTTNNIVNFTGIKIGDIDASHNPGNFQGADEKELEVLPLYMDDQRLEEGRYYKVPMYMEGSVDLAALQFALQFDTTILAFEGIDTDATTICRSDNFGYRFLEDGVITACWFDQNVLETNHLVDSDITLFHFRFLAKKDGRLSTSMALSPELVDGLAFERKDDLLQKDLKRKLTALQFNTPGQNSTIVSRSALEIFPNPSSDNDLWIRYTLNEDSTVKINIFNALGQPIQSIFYKERRSKGTYTYKWNTSGLPEGSYFIRLNTNAVPVIRKLVKVY